MNESVLGGKRVIREIKRQWGENELRVINEQAQATNNRVYQEQMVCSEKMSWEIELRCASLISKCRISLDELKDYQMLELSKNMCNLDAEHNDLLDKVTLFTKYVLG